MARAAEMLWLVSKVQYTIRKINRFLNMQQEFIVAHSSHFMLMQTTHAEDRQNFRGKTLSLYVLKSQTASLLGGGASAAPAASAVLHRLHAILLPAGSLHFEFAVQIAANVSLCSLSLPQYNMFVLAADLGSTALRASKSPSRNTRQTRQTQLA
jgi:hypothetical protein